MRRAAHKPEEELHRLLSHLQEAELIYEQQAFPEVEYIFKHALTQEVAYNSVLIERHKVLHERAAQALERLFQVRLEDHYDELAHHYSRSGNEQEAIEYRSGPGNKRCSGRLMRKQGKKKEARQVLVEIYNWFTEGFDTADLQDAKALWEEMQR